MSRKNPPTNTSSYQPITYLSDGAPYSDHFDDIYFDTAQGTKQSQVVFIEGNELKKQWNNFENEIFTIAETGFGTGLNFLLTLKAFENWLKNKPANRQTLKLHFVSTEKYPLSKEELSKSLNIIPELAQYSAQLIDGYPEIIEERITLSLLEGQIELTVYIDDATLAFEKLGNKSKLLVNAWFLDGFCPSKNPDMWQPKLYSAMAKVSQSEASLATFTVAGHVRRGLAHAGFRLEKKSTSLNKNHILIGKLQTTQYRQKGYMNRPRIAKPQLVTIIGGGIASACAAWSLSQKGVRVQLLCKDKALAQEASSNPIGAIYPLIHQTPDIISKFFSKAFFHARNYYDDLVAKGFEFDHQWCGLVEVAHNESVLKRQEKFDAINSWPEELVKFLPAEEINEIASIEINKPGLFFEKAGWASPAQLVKQLINAAIETGNCKVRLNTEVKSIEKSEKSRWKITTNKGQLNTQVLVICGGADSHQISGLPQINTYPVQGQVSVMAENKRSQQLSTVLCHKGYVTPANEGKHCIGATFKKMVNDKIVREEDNQFNLEQLHKELPDSFDWEYKDLITANAKVRACTSDHLPIVGIAPDETKHKALYKKLSQDKNWKVDIPQPVIDNLYILTGLGARGLCSAPLLADILTAELCGDIYPVDQDLLFNLAPNRFVVKDIVKGKVNFD